MALRKCQRVVGTKVYHNMTTLHDTKYREDEEIEAIESERAKERQGTRTDIVPILAPSSTGKTRKKVAEAIGMKHSTYEAGKKVYIAAKYGNEKAQTLMKQLDAGQDKGLLQCNNPSQHRD